MTSSRELKPDPNDLGELAQAVRVATATLEDRRREEAQAGTRATEALNTLNQAQRALDAAFAKMRSAAPRDSDWKRASIPRGIEIAESA